jgi:hypothetical protein
MTAVSPDVFDSALQALEAGFRVLHIATFDLKTCAASDDAEQTLKDPALAGFDQVPVEQDSRIVGVLERRAQPRSGAVARCMRPIDPSCLVSAEAPLRSFIPLVANSPYWLVVRVAGIKGIVTRSDLLKLPVRLHAFTMITHLESVMAEVIRRCRSSDKWLALMDDDRLEKLRKKERMLRAKRLDPPAVELTDFCDKRDIVAKLLGLGEEFTEPLRGIEDLRNSIAHAATFVEDDTQMQQFVDNMLAAEKWIDRLHGSLAHEQREE